MGQCPHIGAHEGNTIGRSLHLPRVHRPGGRLGRRVEVEGRKLEVEEESMTGWCQVRRKGGQEEKVVSAVSRVWEEYRRKFSHLAHEWKAQRQEWSERKVVRAWLEGGDEARMEEKEECRRKLTSDAQKREVEKWLRGGGGM